MTERADPSSKEATIRFSLNGATSDEGELLYKALQDVAEHRRGAELLRQLAMRGWMDIIHSTHPRERVMLLRSMGLSQAVISAIECQFPIPLLHQAQSADSFVRPKISQPASREAEPVVAPVTAQRDEETVPIVDEVGSPSVTAGLPKARQKSRLGSAGELMS